MNKNHANTSATARLEPTNASSASNDRINVSRSSLIRAQETLEEASQLLAYNRRQEGEQAVLKIRAARELIAEACAPGEGKSGSKALHGKDSA